MIKRTILTAVCTAITSILSVIIPLTAQANPKKTVIPTTPQSNPLKEALCTKDWGQAVFLVEKQIAGLPSNEKETKAQLSSYRAHLLGVEAGFIVPKPNEFESLGCPKPPETKPTAKQDAPSNPANTTSSENKNPTPTTPK